MGDALDTLTLRELCDAVREQIGPKGKTLSHTVDVIVTETCRWWPEKAMGDIARKQKKPKAAEAALNAITVTTAKVREQIEARWGCQPSDQAALDLVLRGCVVEVANIWFACPDARRGIRGVIKRVRAGTEKV